jgi:hypothetical protein
MIAAFSIQNETRGLEVGVAATLPATTLKILIALITTTLASRLLAATLPARLTLATLTALTTLTTLSLAVALRVIGIRSHNASSEKGTHPTLANCASNFAGHERRSHPSSG